MKRRNIVLAAVIAVIAIIALAEGSIYFFKFSNDIVLYITIMVHNVFSLFLFDPGISIQDAANFLAENPSLEMTILTCFYGVTVLTAQLFTATVILRAFWFGARRFLSAVPTIFGEHLIIFGYNDKVEMLLANRSNNKAQRKMYIRLVTDENFPRDKELQLLKDGVFVFRENLTLEDEKSLRKLARHIGLKRAKRVILLDHNAINNVSWFIKLTGTPKSSKATKYYIYSTSEEVEQMLIKTQDYKIDQELKRRKEEKKRLEQLQKEVDEQALDAKKTKKLKKEYEQLKKQEEENPINDYYFFDENELKILDLFGTEGSMLHTYNMQMKGDEPKLGKYDMHLLIVGFGDLGQQMLLHTMSMGVFSATGRMLVDVLDQSVFEQKSKFENRFNMDYLTMTDDEISLEGDDRSDGSLKIRFHQLDIRKKAFKDKLALLDEEMPITYVAICLPDPETAMHSAIEVEDYLHRPQNASKCRVPIAVRLEVDDFTLTEIRNNKGFFDEIVPMKTDSDIFDLDVICDQEKENQCRQFNRMYNAIADAVYDVIEAAGGSETLTPDFDYLSLVLDLKDTKSDKDTWNTRKYFQKRSNRRLYAHQKVKQWLCEGRDVFGDREFLDSMAIMEHRRWNYFTVSEGWGYTPNNKDELRRLTPYLVDWEKLKNTHMEVCHYDLIALAVLHQKK